MLESVLKLVLMAALAAMPYLLGIFAWGQIAVLFQEIVRPFVNGEPGAG